MSSLTTATATFLVQLLVALMGLHQAKAHRESKIPLELPSYQVRSKLCLSQNTNLPLHRTTSLALTSQSLIYDCVKVAGVVWIQNYNS